MRRLLSSSLGLLFIIEAVYFNIVFDFGLLFLFILTSLSLGSYFKIKVFGIDKVLSSFTLGLGSLCFLLWLSTFYNFNYRSLYLVFSVLIIYLRKKFLVNYLSIISNTLKQIYKSNFVLLFIIAGAFIAYIPATVAPISSYDSLAKHIIIPWKILHHSHYDYNVIESIIFGDYALLSHMPSLYLLALSGTKAIVMLVEMVSFITLFMLLRITSFVRSQNLLINGTALLYLSTPLVFSASSHLMTDIYVPLFTLSSLLFIQYKSNLSKNILFIALLLGFSLFSKPVAFYIVIPLVLVVLFYYAKQKILFSSRHLLNLALSGIVGMAIFSPAIALIWYKTGNPFFPFNNATFNSIYYDYLGNFTDPFSHVLNFDIKSLWSIVFNTSKNTEFISGGIGYYLLLVPFAFITAVIKFNSRVAITLFIALMGYFLSIQVTNNIRYFFTSIILLIPVVIYFISFIDSKYIPQKKILPSLVIILLCIFGVKVIGHGDNFWGFRNGMLKPDFSLTNNANQSVLNTISNNKDIKLLSNNDNLRGLFLGRYYTFNWYNHYIREQLDKSNLTPYEFIRNFDYYLISKHPRIRKKDKFDPTLKYFEGKLKLTAESPTHVLYKVIHQKINIIDKVFDEPITVNVANSQFVIFENLYTDYSIDIEVKSEKQNVAGRFQIQWFDSNGKAIGLYIDLYTISGTQSSYSSKNKIMVPPNATHGKLYLTSHTKDYISIKSYKLKGIRKFNFIDNLEKIMGKKFPPIAN